MSAIVDFKDKLVAGGLGTFGADLFIGAMPGTQAGVTDLATALKGVPSPDPDRVSGEGAAGVVFYMTAVQARTRGATYLAGLGRMEAIVTLMDNFVGAINGHDYLHIVLRGGIYELGQDEHRRYEFSATFHMKGRTL